MKKPITTPWRAMVAVLRGQPAPPPAPLPGRQHLAPPTGEADPYAERWDAEHRLADDPDEVGCD